MSWKYNKRFRIALCDIKWKDTNETQKEMVILINATSAIRYIVNDERVFYYCENMKEFNGLLKEDNDADFQITNYEFWYE